MTFEPNLIPGQTISNRQLTELFQCSPQGGMRRSHKTGSLVIVSDYTKSLYDDWWDSQGIFHYTGMGMSGDQSFDFAQNKTLAQSAQNDTAVFLFEVFTKGQYVFAGRVELAGDPYEAEQMDTQRDMRKVWIFPLRVVGTAPVAIPEELIKAKEQIKKRLADKITDQDLLARLKNSAPDPRTRNVSTHYFERDPYVGEYAKRRAAGICQLCEKPGPFVEKSTGRPYLENHHIVWLSRGGGDTVSNTVALCPNCHAQMHVLDRDEDKKKLISKAGE